jgi:3-oxoacyl-[acyl-carrier-protein] synthase-3
MPSLHAKIVSVGSAVPKTVLTNKDLEGFLDTSDEWIRTRTGIHQRRVFPKEQNGQAFELGAEACKHALERAGCEPSSIDGIICATFTPDYFFPSTACLIGNTLGCGPVAAFDISAACAGFVYGLSVANAMISAKQCRRMLLVGSEIISKTLDWTDRSTCILFGDGAGAVVLEATDDPGRGVMTACLSSDGGLKDILYLPAWGERRTMMMKGGEVFKHAVRMMNDTTRKCFDACGITADDIDVLIPHQANLRIINSLADHLGVAREKVVTNLHKYGNTSSASIPLALEDAWGDGRITPGTCTAFASLGGGVAAGSAIVRF